MRHCCRQVIIGPCPSYYTHTYIDLLWPWPDTYGHMQGNNIAIMSRSSCLGSLAVQNGRKRRSMFPDNTTSAPVSLHCASPRSTFPLPDSLTGTLFHFIRLQSLEQPRTATGRRGIRLHRPPTSPQPSQPACTPGTKSVVASHAVRCLHTSIHTAAYPSSSKP